MPDVELARRPGVELVRTGRFQTLTGSWNPTPADIRAAVEAMNCPAIRKPVIRIGHTDRRFVGDGEPALGWFENLRATDSGHTLVADQVTLPWLHSVQAAAYPSRSIEGNYNHRCSEGHVHPFVIHTVALLGVTPPGVQTLRSLNDLPDLLGVAASGEVPDGAEHVQVTVMAATGTSDEPVHTGAMVALIPTAEDAARLAVDGGEPADQLHVTLAYLGEAADLGAQGQQDVIDAVSATVNGMPTVDADVFALSVFNPGSGNDREPCIVYGLSGDFLDAVHDFIMQSLDESPAGTRIPPQHQPWFAHITAQYTNDLGVLASLVDRVGPVRFDRLRLAFGGTQIDIPLIDWANEPDDPSEVADADGMVAAAVGDRNQLKSYWLAGPGLAKWADKPHPWTALFKQLRKYIKNLDEAKRTASQWYREHFGHMPNQKGVKAAEAPPTPDLPAAEPEQPNTEPKEDLVSTELSGLRSRLGLDDSADLDAITAAVDDLKAKADTPAEPTPEMVAASAAATDEAEKAKAAQELMKEELTKVREELNVIKASAATTVKASFFQGLKGTGRLKPADEELWSSRYDRDPEMVTEILSGRAESSEVPVMASGTVGSAEPETQTDGVSADEAAAWAGMWGIPSEELTRG